MRTRNHAGKWVQAGIFLTLLSFLCATAAYAQTFSDNFNRPDSDTIGNGWSTVSSDGSGPGARNLVIRTGEVTTAGPGYSGGIYRPFSFSTPVTISATLKEGNGFGGSLQRYTANLSLGGTGAFQSGYGLTFSRSDQNFANSTITLFDGNTQVATVSPTFQFGPSINTTFIVAPNGRVTGNVSQGSQTFAFTFGPRAVQSSGTNFSYATEGPDSRSGVITNPRFDNLQISSGVLPTVAPTVQTPNPSLTTRFNPSSTQLKVFDGQQFVNIDAQHPIDSRKPTLVMTHGWKSSPNAWAQSMGTAINQTSPNSANIVAWDWRQDANQGLGGAAGRTHIEGESLGDALASVLGSGYQKPIHFLGHSLGTLVNAQAVDEFRSLNATNPHVQVTLFDDAEAASVLRNVVRGDVFYAPHASPIPAAGVEWIDNYVSAVGNLHSEAANVVLTKGADGSVTAFHSYPQSWYSKTIGPSASSTLMGYRYDNAHGGLDGSQPPAGSYFIQNSNPELSLRTATEQQARAALGQNTTAELIGTTPLYVTTPQVNGSIRYNGHISVGLDPVLQLDASGGSSPVLTPSITLIKNSPSYAWVPLSIPDNAELVSFDFTFTNLSPDDYLSAGINDELLFAIESRFVADGLTMNSGLIDISQWAGQDVQFFLGLNNSDDIAGGTMTVSGIQYHVVPEPSSLIFGIIALAVLRRPRRSVSAANIAA